MQVHIYDFKLSVVLQYMLQSLHLMLLVVKDVTLPSSTLYVSVLSCIVVTLGHLSNYCGLAELFGKRCIECAGWLACGFQLALAVPCVASVGLGMYCKQPPEHEIAVRADESSG